MKASIKTPSENAGKKGGKMNDAYEALRRRCRDALNKTADEEAILAIASLLKVKTGDIPAPRQ